MTWKLEVFFLESVKKLFLEVSAEKIALRRKKGKQMLTSEKFSRLDQSPGNGKVFFLGFKFQQHTVLKLAASD